MNETLILSQLTSSALIVWFINWLKGLTKVPWINHETQKLNRALAITLAGAAALGIHANFDHHAGVLTITGLTLVGILHGCWEWLRSYVMQQLVYKATKSTP